MCTLQFCTESGGNHLIVILVVTVMVVLLLMGAVAAVIRKLYTDKKIKNFWRRNETSSLSNLSKNGADGMPNKVEKMVSKAITSGGDYLKAIKGLTPHHDLGFRPVGEIQKRNFAAHVDKFDAKGQLCFQEEFDVSEMVH